MQEQVGVRASEGSGIMQEKNCVGIELQGSPLIALLFDEWKIGFSGSGESMCIHAHEQLTALRLTGQSAYDFRESQRIVTKIVPCSIPLTKIVLFCLTSTKLPLKLHRGRSDLTYRGFC